MGLVQVNNVEVKDLFECRAVVRGQLANIFFKCFYAKLYFWIKFV